MQSSGWLSFRIYVWLKNRVVVCLSEVTGAVDASPAVLIKFIKSGASVSQAV